MKTQILEQEIAGVQLFAPGAQPNYDKENPVWKLADAVQETELAAEREHYVADSLQYLLPYRDLALYGPSGAAWQTADPRLQENKNDFQKQNIRSFQMTGTQLVRGYASVNGWTGSFLRLSYSPGTGSPLAGPGGYYRGSSVQAYLKIGGASTGAQLITLPYNETTHRYEAELWGFSGHDLRPLLGPKGQAAIDRGELLVRSDLVRGSLGDFQGPLFDLVRDQARQQGRAVEMFDYAPDHSMHPLRPLHVEVAWRSSVENRWDSRGGANYHYEFAMSFRGWGNYLGVGQSANPHGGVGTLEFRNLYSNYFGYEARRRQAFGPQTPTELGRELEPWNVDAHGRKPSPAAREPFLAVDYMDLHILRPRCAIGIHRHRDNQEVFLMLQGRALMVLGDWLQQEGRERAFEVRTMKPGDLALVKGGQLHALINALDENVQLFMFGGYD
jgi:mannose-6-phosphate isomerase-like protein (cupin superfamily)